MSESIELFITVRATVAEIWRALTDADDRENWWGEDVVLDAKVGGSFREPWEDDEGEQKLASGKVTAIKVNKEITFTWKEKDWPANAQTTCTFSIEDKGKTRALILNHSGWEIFPPAKQKKIMKDFQIGWTYHLQELKAYLDD